jgi:hypothetical protein
MENNIKKEIRKIKLMKINLILINTLMLTIIVESSRFSCVKIIYTRIKRFLKFIINYKLIEMKFVKL